MTTGGATMSAQTGTAMNRRSLLRLLMDAAAVCLVASCRASGARAILTERPPLTPAQARLAAFGARLEAADPDTADRLFALACDTSRRHAGWLSGPNDACTALLEETRVRQDFYAGQTQSIDGWMLARSEAAACVFLHRLGCATPAA